MTRLPRIDLPPSADQLIALPGSFGRRFLVTVDTEEEFDWSMPFAREAHGTAALGALPHSQSRMEEAGVRPLDLVDHAVASDPRAACLADWARRGSATVGAHMHPWTTPPYDEALSGPNSFAGNLPRRSNAPRSSP